jgi:recombination protein RecR
MLSPVIIDLIQSFKKLPGVGQKTAQRLALHLLDKDRDAALQIQNSISQALSIVRYCEKCQCLSDHKLCNICSNEKRDASKLCVVESILDLVAIESSNVYQGRYFVLNGVISPLDGIGPVELRLPDLLSLSLTVSEMVLAINPTVEGDATVHFIQEMHKSRAIEITRIAYGVPFGGELEYLDQKTLSHAFSARGNI